MVATFLDDTTKAELRALRQQLADAKAGKVDLKAALDLANADLRATDKQYRDLLRKQREANPEPDETLRRLLAISDHGDGRFRQHEVPYAERELFEERLQSFLDDRPERGTFVLRVRFYKFQSLPVEVSGSVGVDREWTANLLPGSVRRELSAGVIGASYEIEVV